MSVRRLASSVAAPLAIAKAVPAEPTVLNSNSVWTNIMHFQDGFDTSLKSTAQTILVLVAVCPVLSIVCAGDLMP